MRVRFLPSPSLASTVIRKALILLAGAVVWLSPLALDAQSVTFAGAQSTLPTVGVYQPRGIALDSLGDVFIADGHYRVAELFRTATGYGTQKNVPAKGLAEPFGVAVDGAGDVFISDTNEQVVEVPRTATGYGPQTTLATGLASSFPPIATDDTGDVFIQDAGEARTVELPLTATGYGPPVKLPFSGSFDEPQGIAVDSAGDVFLADYGNDDVVELPMSATGYGPQTVLPFSGLKGPYAVAVDSAGDFYVVDYFLPNRVFELPRTAAGYGSQITLPFSGLFYPSGVAVDNAGDVFLSDTGNNRVLEMQTRSVAFESANVCQPGQVTPQPCNQTMTLNFSVNAVVTLGTPKVLTGGAPDLDFMLDGSTCTGAFTEGTTCIVNVTFAPLALGLRNGSVEITDDSGNVLSTATISGYGVAGTATYGPVAQLSGTTIQFGSLPFGESSQTGLGVTNTGGGTLTLDASLNGQSYKIGNSNCGAGLTSGNSCYLPLSFSPLSVGAHNDILTVRTDEANGSNIHAISLQGTATGVSPTSKLMQFGTIPFGSSRTMLLTFTNTATSGTALLGAVTTSPSYTILTTAQNTCQAGVAAGQSCTLPIQFSPVVVGPHNDYLNLTLSADGPATTFVSLNGFASGVGTELATPLNFGTLPAYTTAVLPLTITNFGVPGTVTIGTAINGPSFKVLTTTDNTCLAGISAGQSCTLPVEFLANSVGTHNELLTLTPSGGAATSVVHLDAVEAAP